MAKISSTAQNQPTAAPVRSTRQTRSMSTEPVENTRPSSSTHRRAQNQSDNENTPRNGKGRKPKSKPAPPDLTTVEEDVEIEQEPIPVDDETELQAHALAQTELAELANLPRERRVSITASAMSGTTAKTSFSQEELELLDHEIMVKELPQLAKAAQDLAQLLLPDGLETQPGTWKEVKRTGSKRHRHHQRFLFLLNTYKQSFGTMPYIRPDLVLRGVLSMPDVAELPSAPWRPDNILLKINLATMLNHLLVTCDISNWTSQCSTALEQLLVAFPACITGGEFSRPALEFYLNLAAQVVITHLEASSNSAPTFSPYETIDDTFFDGEGVFRHEETLGISRLGEADQRSAFGMVKHLAEALKAPFKAGNAKDATVGVGRLKAQFRWDSFQDHTVRYAHAWSTQLQQSIAQAGGIDRILDGLGQEVQEREEEKYVLKTKRKSLEAKRKSLTGVKTLQNLMSSFPEARKIAAIAAEDDEEGSVVPELVPAPRTIVVDSDSLFIPQDDGEHPGELAKAPTSSAPARSSLQVSVGLQELQRRNAARQQRRLIDPQPNAQRVQFIEDEELKSQYASAQPTARPSSHFKFPSSSAISKRSAAEMEEDDEVPDPTQDEGFQTDTRSQAGAAQRRREVSFARTNRGSASVGSIDLDPGPSTGQSIAPGPSPAKRQRKNPGSTVPPPLSQDEQKRPDEDRLSLYERAKVIAKRDRVTARMAKPQRVRRPWTDDEEAHLINLIEQHGADGISYALIKEIDDSDDDPKLRARSAEDIRFKARNMKATLLLSGCALPDNWDKVVLDKKSIDKLHARNIEYHQERLRHPLDIDFQ
ncbi:hypothetical protein DOTSEDRAFT_73698 [Dothistroma septosporum NZE10]|uniref:Myb-like domain-containing protein n=1 Tax=Dothistroma septosporum (strain NZE10 / CBS 128990) TaxID=675120 RepID=N1PJ57_DOTSN|nr:hypothetical protein DOTSEDRAFT_73698 [Dothistroma septosporum NZE10]